MVGFVITEEVEDTYKVCAGNQAPLHYRLPDNQSPGAGAGARRPIRSFALFRSVSIS